MKGLVFSKIVWLALANFALAIIGGLTHKTVPEELGHEIVSLDWGNIGQALLSVGMIVVRWFFTSKAIVGIFSVVFALLFVSAPSGHSQTPENMASRHCILSDTHSRQRQIQLPPCNVILVSGDLTHNGTEAECWDFVAWLHDECDRLGAAAVICPGNHDKFISENPAGFQALLNAYFPQNFITLVSDSSHTLSSITYYGCPWVPYHPRFAGMPYVLQSGPEIAEKFALIPTVGIDVLLTHSPPYGILDQSSRRETRGLRLGSHDLIDRMPDLSPLLHVFGHIHDGYGFQDNGSLISVNGSVLDSKYLARRPPRIVDIDIFAGTAVVIS